MKIKSLIFISGLFIIFFIGGCGSKENYNIRMTIEPADVKSISTISEIKNASEIIKKRLNSFGIQDEQITMEVQVDKILLSLTGIDTSKTETLKSIITTNGKLEFWETYENSEIGESLLKANQILKEAIPPAPAPEKKAPVPDSLKTVEQLMQETADSTESNRMEEFKRENPLFGILYPQVDAQGGFLTSSRIGLAKVYDTARVMELLYNDKLKYTFPSDLRFYWSHDPYAYDQTHTLYELHAIKCVSSIGRAALDGKFIAGAKVVSKKSMPDTRLNIMMTAEGTRLWKNITKNNIDRCIAIVVDGHVRSYPRVMAEIDGGETEITGDFSPREAEQLACIFNSGGEIIPLQLEITDFRTEISR